MNSLRNVRCFSTNARLLAKNHYDSLGITPKATQSDVKAAYYKLSMTYHPDKNKDNEAATQKFRDITEAYEVLGNVRLRRLYDKGVSHVGGSQTAEPENDPTSNFYKSREHKSRPPMTGRTPIYDFDEWSRSHYGATFAKDMERKRRTQFRQKVKQDNAREAKTNRILAAILVTVVCFIYISRDLQSSDQVYVINDAIVRKRD